MLPVDIAAQVAAAKARAAKINQALNAPSSLTPSNTPTQPGLSTATGAFPWSTGQSQTSSSSSITATTGPTADQNPLSQLPTHLLTARGIQKKIDTIVPNKSSYAGGPILSIKEAQGAQYGLYRSGFKARNEMKIVKLLIGLEVSITNMIGFPLIQALLGIYIYILMILALYTPI